MMLRRAWFAGLLVGAVIAGGGWAEAAKKSAAPVTSKTARQQQSYASAPVDNYPKVLGAGLVLGDPVGINGKYWLNRRSAVSAAIGSSLGPGRLAFYGDYLYHIYPFEEAPELPVYLGGGAFLGGASSFFWTGVRGVIGISYLFEEPFDVFMEIYPRFVFSPEAGVDFTLAIGARVYFNIHQ